MSEFDNVILFKYVNHKGEKRVRTITFESVTFEFHPGYGYQPGWFVNGLCHDKQMRRSFALTRIEFPEEDTFVSPRNARKPFTLFKLKGTFS